MYIYIICESEVITGFSSNPQNVYQWVSVRQLRDSTSVHRSLFPRIAAVRGLEPKSGNSWDLGWSVDESILHGDMISVCRAVPIRTPHVWLTSLSMRRRASSLHSLQLFIVEFFK